jgi:protein-tyrosine phosphatase
MYGDASKLELIKAIWFKNPIGYLKYKLRAMIRVPDMDEITHDFYIGGETSKIPEEFAIINLRYLPEGDYIKAEDLETVVNSINYNLTKFPVFCHCRHGRGRAPVVACAFLIKYRGMSVYNAISFVEDKRPNTCINTVQIQCLEDFSNKVNRGCK